MPDSSSRRSTLSADDLHARVREAAFALVLTGGKPASPEDIAALAGISPHSIASLLDELEAVGWIDRDATWRVTG